MSLSSSDIRLIVDALQDSGWDQATVVVGDVRISVARNGLPLDGGASASAPSVTAAAEVSAAPAAPAPAAAAPVPAAAPAPAADAVPSVPGAEGGHVISAPSVGVFWRSSQPGAAPFVEIGAKVKVGDTVGIVEVMKLMSNVASDVNGTVTAIHVANAGAVEFGTPLLTIRVED